jgi:hypothetical protein
MKHMLPEGKGVEVVVAGDVRPTRVPDGLVGRLGLSRPPDMFLFTLDAAVAGGPPADGQTCISFLPDALDDYRLAPVTVAVTASNHVTDFGDSGFRATLDALECHSILSVGAGAALAEVEQPLVVELPMESGRLAILAFAETTDRVGARAVTAAAAGIRAFEPAAAERAVRAAAAEADWVWVILHWGDEFVRYPDPEQRRTAWRLVDAGASLVAASHTHVPLGYERHGQGMIFYGLGNLVFPGYREQRGFSYRWPPMARRGLIACGRLEGGSWTWTSRPVRHGTDGLPWLDDTAGECPDFGLSLPGDGSAYENAYSWLRRRERATYLVQRLMFMSFDERVWRLERLFGVRDLRHLRSRD